MCSSSFNSYLHFCGLIRWHMSANLHRAALRVREGPFFLTSLYSSTCRRPRLVSSNVLKTEKQLWCISIRKKKTSQGPRAGNESNFLTSGIKDIIVAASLILRFVWLFIYNIGVGGGEGAWGWHWKPCANPMLYNFEWLNCMQTIKYSTGQKNSIFWYVRL